MHWKICLCITRKCNEEEPGTWDQPSPTVWWDCGGGVLNRTVWLSLRLVSSTLANIKEVAVLVFVSLVWNIRQKQSLWPLGPWQRHLAQVSHGLVIMNNKMSLYGIQQQSYLLLSVLNGVTLLKCFLHMPLLLLLDSLFLVSENVNFLHLWSQEKWLFYNQVYVEGFLYS